VRVLVTGTSGHVGGAVARALVEAGEEVVGLSRRWTKIAGLVHSHMSDIGAPGLAARVADPPCDAIVHAAASLATDPHDPSVSLVNALGTQQVLELAALWEVQAFVYISSVAVIGTPRELPITETHPTAPATAYAASKLYGEQLTELAAARGLAASSLRVTSPVGPGMAAGRIFSVFVERALAGQPLVLAGGGGRRQDYVDVRDIAGAVLACLAAQARGCFNVAAGASVSNLELARLCVQTLQSASAVTFGGTADPLEDLRFEMSIERARTEFGYAPCHDLQASLLAVAADARRAGRGGQHMTAPQRAAAPPTQQ
jgi:nucleoside-diphosphate-sugar epimerase